VRVALAGRLDTELETIVYRVTQEALLNVTRDAQAKRLWLELEGGRRPAPSWSATATSAWW